MPDIQIFGLSSFQLLILVIVATVYVTSNFGDRILAVSSSALSRTKNVSSMLYVWIRDYLANMTTNKALLVLLVVTLFPNLKEWIPDSIPLPIPTPVPAESKDYLDKCHDTYRQLLGNLYSEVADKDLTDPDVYDAFEDKRQNIYTRAYTEWNSVVQQHAIDGTLGTLAEQMKNNDIPDP